MGLHILVFSLVLLLAACSRQQTASPWPQRPLLEANFADSLEHRYLHKPVHASRVIDDMEADGNWTATGIGQLGYTQDRAKDGKRSLRFRTSMRDEAHIKANIKDGGFAGGQGGSTRATLRFAPPMDWRPYNRISLWVYVHPTSMQSYSFSLHFDCEGAPSGAQFPVRSHFVHDLKHGEWNHIVWEIPHYQRDQVSGFRIQQILRGHEPEDEGIVTYDFDRIEIQRVDPEKYEGWEVAPGKIAFHHLGYRPAGEKVALAAGAAGGRFELVDAASGEVALTAAAREVKNRRGRFQVLDFTAHTKPGSYFLRYGEAAGRPFSISDTYWYGAIEKALNAYYGLRCGFSVAGVHRVCHQDWQGIRGNQKKIINGGWHDAGDLSQGSHRTGASVYAMLRIYDELRQRGEQPELPARILEEARWGLDWLLKTRFGDGYRITWALGRIYTDNQVGSIDDMVAQARHIEFENFLFAAVAAYAARVLEQTDPQQAGACRRAAVEDFQATLHARTDWSKAKREEAAFGALAARELYLATGEETYAQHAAAFGRLLLKCQEQRFVEGIPIAGYFYEDTTRERIVHDYHMSFEEAPLVALEALCGTFPQHPDWMEWYAAAVMHSEFFLRRGAAISSPYDLLPNSVWRRSEVEALEEKAEGRAWSRATVRPQFEESTPLAAEYRLRTFPIWRDNLFHGNTAIQLSGTTALEAAAKLRNDASLARLAERQLGWVFGNNPFSQSLMYGVGYDYQPQFVYCLRNLVGGLPVGMDSLRNDTPYWPSHNTATYKEIWVVPQSRLLWSLASAAMPARVAGNAPAGATFRELQTARSATVQPGRFAINLPPGMYEIRFAGVTRRYALLAGSRYDMLLDAARNVAIRLTAQRTGPRAVRVAAQLEGAGEHILHLGAFNATVEQGTATVRLEPGQARTVVWNLTVRDPQKPWIAVVRPGNDASNRSEIFGVLTALRPLPAD